MTCCLWRLGLITLAGASISLDGKEGEKAWEQNGESLNAGEGFVSVPASLPFGFGSRKRLLGSGSLHREKGKNCGKTQESLYYAMMGNNGIAKPRSNKLLHFYQTGRRDRCIFSRLVLR